MSYKDESLMKLLKERGTVLEVCPVSNYLVGIVPSIKEHPLKKLIAAGVRYTISTGSYFCFHPDKIDDPGLFGHSLNEEYQRILDSGLLTLEDLKLSNEVAYEASFLPKIVKEKFWANV